MNTSVYDFNTTPQRKLNIDERVLPSLNVAWHYHEEFEIVYITKSNGIRFVGDSVAPFFLEI